MGFSARVVEAQTCFLVVSHGITLCIKSCEIKSTGSLFTHAPFILQDVDPLIQMGDGGDEQIYPIKHTISTSFPSPLHLSLQ